MAANKFATMLHRNTNKITLILIYAVLEWTLIILLLLNSLFSYVIIKFADYFGLKPPCPWCSRVDRFFEPDKKKYSNTDLLCEYHATEISKLGYCSNHQKLAEWQDMCQDCLSSKQGFCENFLFSKVKQIDMVQSDGEVNLKCSCCGVSFERNAYSSPYFAIHPSWDIFEYTRKGNLIPEFVDDLDHIEKSNVLDRIGSGLLNVEFEENQGFESKGEDQMLFDVNEGLGLKETEEACSDSNSISKFGVRETEETGDEAIKEETSNTFKEDPNSSDQNLIDFCEKEILPHLEFFIDYSGHQLIPIELIDSTTEEHQTIGKVDEDQEYGDYQKAHVNSDFQIECKAGEKLELLSIHENTEESLSIHQKAEEFRLGNQSSEALLSLHHNTDELVPFHANKEELKVDVVNSMELASIHENTEESKLAVLNSMELASIHENTEESKLAVLNSMELEEPENSLVFHAKEIDFTCEKVAMTQANQFPSTEADDIQENAATKEEESDSDIPSVHEEGCQMTFTDNEAEVSIGTEIPVLNSTDEIKAQDNFSLYAFTHEEPSTSSFNLHTDNVNENGFDQKAQEEEIVELKTLKVQMSETLNEIEEEKIPDTPTSLDSLTHLHKKLLLLERRESGAEESLDGSVMSELEGGDAVTTAERLKSALKAERKALHALYAELEEERSASAVAANQTMAMINRLQEEKAAMQMEALQYQRMMEEQSEYDQEALQLLNELMVKREKEKQELERELEAYRKRVLDYETKERIRFLRRSKDGSTKSGTCSASCSHSDDGDGISIDLNQEVKEEDNSFDGNQEGQNHNTPIDAVLNMESSLAEFEEERMSILEQLKVLEEKLFTLSDEEDQHFEDIRPIEDFYEENGKHLDRNYDSDGQEVSGIANGFPREMNGKHYQERRINMGPKGKRLLPLFDAISMESEDGATPNGHENGFHSNKLENSAITRFELEKKRIDIEEEVDQLYGRLQALEADREFLKHCIGSLKKGDKGMELLQEILQHLRDLRNVDIRARNFGDDTLV